MDSELFKEFGMIVKHGNLSEAAKELCLTQSTLSRHLSSIESYAGVQLFDRAHNPMQLTHAGELFMEQANIIASELHKLESLMETVRNKNYEPFTISGLVGTLSASILRATKKRFEEEFTSTIVKFSQSQYQTPFDMLRSGELNIALEPISKMIDVHDLSSRHLMYEKAFLVMEKSNPLAKRNHFVPDDVDSIRFTSLRSNKDHAARKHLQTICLDHGSKSGYPKSLSIENADTFDELFLYGLGEYVIMLPESVAVKYATADSDYIAIPFTGDDVEYDLHLFYANNPSPQVMRFAEIAQEEAAKHKQ